MATIKGQQTSYVATLPQKRVVTDRITMTEPMEIALINALGLDNNSKFQFVNTPGIKYEWLEDTYAPVSDAANDADLTNVTTTTTITVADGTKIQVGDVLQLDDEFVWVSAVVGNDLTVTRGYGGTANVTHASNVVIYIRYSARLEGANASDSPSTEPASNYNYSVIMQKTINVSRSDNLLQRYGIPDLVDREIDKAMDEKKLQLTKLPYYGLRVAGASPARSAGGFDVFITTNVTDLSSAALTQKAVEDAVQSAFDAGGNPSLLVCGSWVKRKITDFYAGYVHTDRDERLGGISIDRILVPQGLTLDVMVDRWCPASKLYILDRNHIGYITLDAFFYETLGKTGDTAEYGQVVGEYGFVARYQKAHAIIKGISIVL